MEDSVLYVLKRKKLQELFWKICILLIGDDGMRKWNFWRLNND